MNQPEPPTTGPADAPDGKQIAVSICRVTSEDGRQWEIRLTHACAIPGDHGLPPEAVVGFTVASFTIPDHTPDGAPSPLAHMAAIPAELVAELADDWDAMVAEVSQATIAP